MFGLQPLIVPVGRIALGRIFNVVGSIIESIISSIQHFVESNSLSLTYALTYPYLILARTSGSTFYGQVNSISLVRGALSSEAHISIGLIFYIAYLYLNIDSSILSQISCWLISGAVNLISSISLNIISHFYSTDTLNAQIKPIHKTPVALYLLTINLRLFETGIKVVDLLTPYKKGGKLI